MEFDEKRGVDVISNNPEERFLVDMFSQITERLKQKYNYSDDEIFSLWNSEKSILESLVCYLKDVKKMKNKNIAKLLNKNPANIWTVHNRAKKNDK